MKYGLVCGLAGVVLASAVLSGCGKAKVPNTPDGAVKAVAKGLTENKPQTVWAAMPASYQKDVTGLVHGFAGKVDAEVYNKSLVVVKKVVAVARDKKEFILKHPMLAQNQQINVMEVDKKWDAVVGLLDTLVNSELSSVEKLKTLDVGQFLAGTGSTAMQHMSKLSSLMPDDPFEDVAKLRNINVEVLSSDAETAKLKITVEGESPEEEEFRKVEGKWVPKDMAEEWAEKMADARKALDEMPAELPPEQKTKIMMGLGAIEPALDQMLKAKTADEFNAAVAQVQAAIMAQMMSAAAAGAR